MNGANVRLAETGAAVGTNDADSELVSRDETRRAWALAIAQAATLEPPRTVPMWDENEAAPAGWRPTDVSMTALGDEVAASDGRNLSAASGDNGKAVVSRLETVVNAGDIGQVNFVVDRSNAGVSIVIEVSSDAAARVVDADRQTLLRSLRSAGLTVLSFRVLIRGGVGTPLAPVSNSNANGVAKSQLRYGRALGAEDDESDIENVDVVG
jgi:hypothetical protein